MPAPSPAGDPSKDSDAEGAGLTQCFNVSGGSYQGSDAGFYPGLSFPSNDGLWIFSVDCLLWFSFSTLFLPCSFAVRFSFENLPPHSPRKLSCLEQLPGSLEAVRAATPYWPTYQVTVFRRGMYDGWLVYPKCVREIACQVFSCRKTDHNSLSSS